MCIKGKIAAKLRYYSVIQRYRKKPTVQFQRILKDSPKFPHLEESLVSSKHSLGRKKENKRNGQSIN